MNEVLVQWLKERWRSWAVGVLVWVLLAAGATVVAGRRGQNPWQVATAWDEWVVAIGLLPRFLIPIFRKSEMQDQVARRAVAWAGEFTWVLAVILLLDLLSRAVLGLGWDPF